MALSLVLVSVLTGCTRSFGPRGAAAASGGQTPQEMVAAIESEIRTAFGDDLRSVDVTQNGARRPTYSGEFTLRESNVVLKFQFPPHDQEMQATGNYGPLLLHDRTLVHNDAIGGNERFGLLVRSFERDFPEERTMSYWPPNEDGTWPTTGERGDSFIRTKLVGRPGPNVIVFDYNDFWSDGMAKALGIYSWDPIGHDWTLVYSGDIPSD